MFSRALQLSDTKKLERKAFAITWLDTHGFNVGYLLVGFEYFQDGFAQKVNQSGPIVDQDRTRRALSNKLLNLFSSPFRHREKPKKLEKRQKYLSTLGKPVPIRSESRPRVGQDRTQQALSNGLFSFLSTPFQHREKPEMLQENRRKLRKSPSD